MNDWRARAMADRRARVTEGEVTELAEKPCAV